MYRVHRARGSCDRVGAGDSMAKEAELIRHDETNIRDYFERGEMKLCESWR